jgi:antitoxin component YwqK of YwqJK toxin-antitoxin module
MIKLQNMKKILISLFILLISYFNSNCQTVKKEYYDYAKTRIMAEYQVNSSGEKHGWFKRYDQQGVLVMEFNYKNNMYDGVCKEYTTIYVKRTMMKSETYKQGVLNGPAKYYGGDTGELLVRQGSYKNDTRDGKWITLNAYKNYNLSDEEKKGSEYFKTEDEYDNGTVIIPDGLYKTYFYPSGKLHSEQEFKDAKRAGLCKWYFPNGSIEREDLFSETGAHLESKEYWPSGQLRTFNNFRNNSYEGYNKDGSPDWIMKQRLEQSKKEARKAAMEDSAFVAFSTGDYIKAENLYKELGEHSLAMGIKHFGEADSYWNNGDYLLALGELKRSKQYINSQIVTPIYDSLYPIAIDSMDKKLEGYVNRNDYQGMNKLLSVNKGDIAFSSYDSDTGGRSLKEVLSIEDFNRYRILIRNTEIEFVKSEIQKMATNKEIYDKWNTIRMKYGDWFWQDPEAKEIVRVYISDIQKEESEKDSRTQQLRKNITEGHKTFQRVFLGDFIEDNYGNPVKISTSVKYENLYNSADKLFNSYLSAYDNEMNYETKTTTGNNVLSFLNVLIEMPKEEAKRLNKELRGIEDVNEIKRILGVSF